MESCERKLNERRWGERDSRGEQNREKWARKKREEVGGVVMERCRQSKREKEKGHIAAGVRTEARQTRMRVVR